MTIAISETHKIAIRTARAHSKAREGLHETWARYLDMFLNKAPGEEEAPTGSDPEEGAELDITTNYPYAFVDTVTAMVVPTKPRVEVIPRDLDRRQQAEAQSHLINWTLKKERLNHTLSQLVSKTVLYGTGFTKTVWNTQRKEVRIYEKDPKMVWPDRAAPRWDEQRYLIEVTILPESTFKDRVRAGVYDADAADTVSLQNYPDWLMASDTPMTTEEKAARESFQWAVIYEYYDFENNRLYHLPEGLGGVLADWPLPFKHFKNPFSRLVFNENMSDLGGLSDIQLIYKLQRILDEIDNLELNHASASIPATLIEAKALEVEEDMTNALREANFPGAHILVRTHQGHSIRDLFAATPTPQLSPSFDKMRNRVINAIEFVLGLPQYARGVIGVAEVATEAALADATLRTRTGRRIQALNDHLSEIALKIVSIYAENFVDGEEDFIIRLEKAQEPVLITREILGLDDFDPVKYFWEYEALEYSPLDNNRQFRLQQLQVFLQFLVGSPFVDQAGLTLELLELLKLGHVFQPAPPAPPEGMMPPGAEAPPPGLTGEGGPIPQNEQVDENGIVDPSTGTLMPEIGVPNPVNMPGRPVIVDTRTA